MIDSPKSSKNQIIIFSILVFFSSLVIFGSSLGSSPIYTRGEGREALVIQDMILQNNFILPLRNGEDIPSKPPMFHWTSLLASKLFGGLNEFTIRFPSFFYGSLALAVFFAFVASLSGVQMGFLATLILGTSFEWIRSSTVARVDMAFTFWLMSGLVCLYFAVKSSKRVWVWFLLAGLSIAGAILGKGPTAVLIAVAILGLYVLLAGEGSPWQRLKRFPFLPAIVSLSLAIIISGTWYYLAFLDQGDSFLTRQLFEENFTRVVSIKGESRGHEKPFFYSFIHLLQAFLPWALLAPFLLISFWRNGKKLLLLTDNGILFCLVWVGVFLLITSISLSKRSVYLLPALPPISYLLAYGVLKFSEENSSLRKSQKFTAVLFGIVTLVIFIIAGGSLYFSFFGDVAKLSGLFKAKIFNQISEIIMLFKASPFLIVIFFICGVIAFSATRLCWQGALQRSIKAIGPVVLTIVVIYKSFFSPAISERLSPNKFAEKVASGVEENLNIYQYQHDFYAINFYLKRNIPFVDDLETLTDEKFYLLIRDDAQPEVIKSFPNTKLIFQSTNNLANGDGRLILFLVNNDSNIRG